MTLLSLSMVQRPYVAQFSIGKKHRAATAPDEIVHWLRTSFLCKRLREAQPGPWVFFVVSYHFLKQAFGFSNVVAGRLAPPVDGRHRFFRVSAAE